MTALLIKNARVFAPQDLGKNDVLMVNDRICRIWRSWMPAARFSRRAFLISIFTSRAAAARADRQHVRRNSCFRN